MKMIPPYSKNDDDERGPRDSTPVDWDKLPFPTGAYDEFDVDVDEVPGDYYPPESKSQ